MTTTQTDELDLVLSVRSRDHGALEELIRRWEKPLFNYVQRMIRDAHDAEEVVQDTFLRAHKALTQQYDEERLGTLALRPWLFRIARNLALNRRRGKRHELEQPLDASPQALRESATPGLAILCEIERKEEILRLDRAIAQLPVEARELVILRFIEEMSYGEIAATTGESEAALRGKVFRSLRSLRDLLGREEGRHEM